MKVLFPSLSLLRGGGHRVGVTRLSKPALLPWWRTVRSHPSPHPPKWITFYDKHRMIYSNLKLLLRNNQIPNASIILRGGGGIVFRIDKILPYTFLCFPTTTDIRYSEWRRIFSILGRFFFMWKLISLVYNVPSSFSSSIDRGINHLGMTVGVLKSWQVTLQRIL